MVKRKATPIRTAILTGMAISSKDLALAQANSRAGAFHHVTQPNDGRARVILPNGMDNTAPIQDHLSLPHED